MQRDQPCLLPLDMREWLSENHLVWFVIEAVDELDTGVFEQGRRTGGRGAAGYDPRMLVVVLVYAYCQGVRSSRQVERLCHTDVAFRVACAATVPDHTTVARFRNQHTEAFTTLFAQVLGMAGRLGMGRFGTVAIDGTKIAANASGSANRGEQWLDEQLAAQVVAQARALDAAEDECEPPRTDKGPDRTDRRGRVRRAAAQVAAAQQERAAGRAVGDQRAQERLAKVRAGEPVTGKRPRGQAGVVEAQARVDQVVAAHQARIDAYERKCAAHPTPPPRSRATGRPMGRRPVPVDEHYLVVRARRQLAKAQDSARRAAERDAKADQTLVANTTDPDSRLMPTRKGFVQGYNTQVAVTADQLIVAVQVIQDTHDLASFVPMMTAARQAATTLHQATANPDHTIGVVLADAGYCTHANLVAEGPDRLVATANGRATAKAATTSPTHGPPGEDLDARQAMDHRLRTPEGAATYKRRGATVEPAIGNLKKILDHFSCRGIEAVTGEANLAAAVFNLLRIYRTRPARTVALATA